MGEGSHELLRGLLLLLLSHSVMSDFSATPQTVAHQTPLSIRCPRQEHWSGLQFPSPGDLPSPGIKLVSSALAGGFITAKLTREVPLRGEDNHISAAKNSQSSCLLFWHNCLRLSLH